jgi:ABC-type sugar transport system substrate-binding protein
MKRKLTPLAVVLLVLLFTASLAIAGGGEEAGKPAGKIPERVGWLGNYMMHEWYQNVQKGMKARVAELGIELEVLDSQQDMAR